MLRYSLLLESHKYSGCLQNAYYKTSFNMFYHGSEPYLSLLFNYCIIHFLLYSHTNDIYKYSSETSGSNGLLGNPHCNSWPLYQAQTCSKSPLSKSRHMPVIKSWMLLGVNTIQRPNYKFKVGPWWYARLHQRDLSHSQLYSLRIKDLKFFTGFFR